MLWCPLPAPRHSSALLGLQALSSQPVLHLWDNFLPFEVFFRIFTRCFSLELYLPDLTTLERNHLQVSLSLSQAGMDSALGLLHPGCRTPEGRCDAEARKPGASKSPLCCRWSTLLKGLQNQSRHVPRNYADLMELVSRLVCSHVPSAAAIELN